MGRNKIYLTEEEKIAVKRQRAKLYYWANKEEQDNKARLRYQQNKNK